MIYGSVCSGIEAASVAWHPLGWRASFLSEIEAFPRAVLAHHYPDTPLHGDFTTIAAGQYDPIDLLVGGTPCQSFSIAGLRGGLDDDRGNLALEYLRLADRLRPRWLVWENVPGVLSSNGGRDFGAILGGMVELGYGFAYRVLDAQFFGVAQRRRRVFVVGYLGDWRRAAAVLFERHSLSGHPAPRRKAGPSVAALTANGVGTCGADDNQGQAGHLIPQAFGGGNRSGPLDVTATLTATLTAKGQRQDFEVETFIAQTLKSEGFDASEDGTGRGTPIVPVAYRTTGNDGCYETGDAVGALTQSTDPNAQIIAFSAKDHGADAMSDLSPTLRAGGHSKSHANAGVMPAVAFSIMPMNSGKDFKGRETDVPQPVMAAGPAGGNQGGDYIVHPINPNALRGDTSAKTPSRDAAGVMRLRDPGLGVGDDGDPADTLQAAGPGAVAFALRGREGGAMPEVEGDGDRIGALRAASGGSSRDYVAFAQNTRDEVREMPYVGALSADSGMKQTSYIRGGSAVRRLTPRECERLQGFPDDYTLIPYRKGMAADGPRYKALGNSMATPVMAWIGRRIAWVEAMPYVQPRAA